MCEQTEINYLDGDVVWVKLGGCWWPGQVTGFHNLPEDIQEEFKKKPLIAAVKFFQEDTYEFVKNYQQIYKYNCTLKDEFIKKGLDKYRSKSKDGSRYMDKFPGDVEMAEKLTGGDPDILNSEKFSPEEKPDIAALFGEKKIPRKKRDRDEMGRRSDSLELVRKITHPRFLKESDHEVRIRQQPSSLPSTPTSLGSPQYPCHLCNFTASRVNVIICHIKSHKSGSSSSAKSKVKSYTQHRNRHSEPGTPKRKYARKEKSQGSKTKSENVSELGKRKQTKQIEKANKKKKMDPKIRDTILADWDDESDEELNLSDTKVLDTNSVVTSPSRTESDFDKLQEAFQKSNAAQDCNNDIIEEAEKLLKETEKLTSININEDSLASNVSVSKSVKSTILDKSLESEKDSKTSDSETNESPNKTQKERDLSNSDSESKFPTSDGDEKKALLSCFDFHEEEPSIPPVRKKGRAFHQKKEIIKEFEMSQALKAEQERESEDENKLESDNQDNITENHETTIDLQPSTHVEDSTEMEIKNKMKEQIKQTVNDVSTMEAKEETEVVHEASQKTNINPPETEVEIVEIFEDEREAGENENRSKTVQKTQVPGVPGKPAVPDAISEKDKKTKIDAKSTEDTICEPENDFTQKLQVETADIERMDHTPSKDIEETMSERFNTETEDETVSESEKTIPEQSETSDTDMVDQDQVPKKNVINVSLNNDELQLTKTAKRRRGRPRKNVKAARIQDGATESTDMKLSICNKSIIELSEGEKKTSESDTERPHSGRRRKPNKKYLESGIYVQDLDQKAPRTDESQSETEDRNTEKMRGKSRRGKKTAGIDKRKIESIERKDETPGEFQDISGVIENNINPLEGDLIESTTDKENMPAEIDTKSVDNKNPTNISENLEKSKEEIIPKVSDEILLPETMEIIVQNDTLETAKITSQLGTIEDKEVEKEAAKETAKEVDSGISQEKINVVDIKDTSTDSIHLQLSTETEEPPQQLDSSKSDVDMLPPKKSQIKKFELSQIEVFDADVSPNKPDLNIQSDNILDKPEETQVEVVKSILTEDKVNFSLETEKHITQNPETDIKAETVESVISQKEQIIPTGEVYLSIQEEVPLLEMKTSEITTEVKQENVEQPSKDTIKVNEQPAKRSSMQTRYKGKFTPDTGSKIRKDKDPLPDEKPVNTFQEAFLKTLQMDKKKGMEDDSDTHVSKSKKGKKVVKGKHAEENVTNIAQELKSDDLSGKLELSENVSNSPIVDNTSQAPIITNFEGIEVVVDQNLEMQTKVEDAVFQNIDQLKASSAGCANISKSLTEDTSKSLSLDVPKLDDSSRTSMSTPSPSSDVTVPVKKREMPRIIENVTLTEPMHILKSKLLDKLPQKGVKHKLESEGTKKGDQKSSPRAKIMKMESVASNSKINAGLKTPTAHMTLAKKLQVLKAEEAETAKLMEAQNEQLNLQTSQSSSTATVTEKFIQQSSQSLADMDLDINSMPFVLSEDVLTPESIEQMPVVISSIIPSSSTIATTLSFTPPTHIVSPAQSQFKLVNESTTESSPAKKKSGTPAILKNKNKAKPTIKSIKTLVPPLTCGVKGLKFQNQTAKTQPVLTQKGTPGKYVVVQTAGGQQLRYSVQGKPGTPQKIAIPAGKNVGSAQVVQQGGKVVILTSTQSGQPKMLPLNISKQLSGKVQTIVTNRGQVYCPVNPQGVITSKTIIAPKGDGASPTTSKLAPGAKIINTQGIITSKSVLTQIPGTMTKTALLGTLSQRILTKGGIYTPISASALGCKTIIGSKTLVTKGPAILSSQNLGTSKAILTPVSQTIGGKTILSSQSIVSSRGTVLTPITGQQVKAIAAKSPSKGCKIQYQTVQQKVQLPMLQKSAKVPISISSQGRSTQVRPASNTVVLHNAATGQKTVQHGKKVAKQTIVQQGANISSQSGTQQTVGMIPHIHQKGKSGPTPTVQRVFIPRNTSRQSNIQQKLVPKIQEPAMSTVHNIQSKQGLSTQLTSIPMTSKSTSQQKHVSSPTTTKGTAKAQISNLVTQQQKNVLSMAMNSAATTNITANLSAPLTLPPLEPIEREKKAKTDTISTETVQKEQAAVEKFNMEITGETEKIEELKVTAQPQIMALPTESSDGTQTYVLVTIDEQGQIQPLDNNTLMSLEGTTQNPDGTRTLYIDPSSLGEAGALDNIVLQFDNGVMPNIQASGTDSNQAIISESFPTSEVMQTSNQDILAAALANTDFQQEINLPENPSGNVLSAGLTQTSLINQTILQSTIIPPTEPISSPSVLETSLTLNQPIMTPLEVPSNLPRQSEATPTSVVSTIPSSLELPITITNPNISYISTGEAQIQIPGNSMPDIGDITKSPSTAEIAQTDIPTSTQYLVIPNLEDKISVETQNVQSDTTPMPSVSYSVSLPNNIVLQTSQVQTTPSMPIIDDTYSESVQFVTSMESPMATEPSFVDVPVSEMLVSKASVPVENMQTQDVTVTSEMIVSQDIPSSSEEPTASTDESSILNKEQLGDVTMPLQEVPITSDELSLQQPIIKEDATSNVAVPSQNEQVCNNDSVVNMQIEEEPVESMTSSMPIIDDTSTVTSESNPKVPLTEPMNFEVTDSSIMDTDSSEEPKSTNTIEQAPFTEQSEVKSHSPVIGKEAASSNEVEVAPVVSQTPPAESSSRTDENSMEIEEAVESKIYTSDPIKQSEGCQRDEPSSQGESDLVQRNMEMHFEETNAETSHETPSQSYEQFEISMTTDSADLPSQSATKSENSREPSQSLTYEAMEIDEEAIATEPPTQSFEHSKLNEASQSYATSGEESTNAPTQSFNELLQNQEERSAIDEPIDDQTFPTQSYEVGKTENISENLETDAEISQEGNIPSQSNDIGTDGIGTSSVSTNNSGLNEDETASSSYVPETPENQERDQDQESAISTSSYEIPPCEELNIASSSVIPDTSVRAEHTSIHDNGVPEIPTSSYNLNPDITSTHVDSVPTSSYEDQVIVEPNVSTSYNVPISMPGLEETCSQNFVTESTDQRNEPSSYYTHHQEVTASYYESVDQETNSRLEEDPQEEVTPSYYEGNPQEASQSYFNPEEATPSYSSHNVSPSYYDPRPESEASQSYYSTDDIEKTEQSSSQQIEASQSFYQEQSDELKLRQQGEATPTYTERYPVDYTLDSSPIERHDLVESSVPATRPTER